MRTAGPGSGEMSSDVGRAAIRRRLIAGLLAALVIVGCAPSPNVQPEPMPAGLARLASSPPPPVRERGLKTFAEAVAALDGARAEALAKTPAQREYAGVLRLLREGQLDEADLPLAGLLRSGDKDVAARARALAFGLLTDRTVSQLREGMAREERAFIEALSHAHSAERWSSSVRAAPQPLRIHKGDIVFVDVAINGTPARLMLDTGADLTCIGSRLAEGLDCEPCLGASRSRVRSVTASMLVSPWSTSTSVEPTSRITRSGWSIHLTSNGWASWGVDARRHHRMEHDSRAPNHDGPRRETLAISVPERSPRASELLWGRQAPHQGAIREWAGDELRADSGTTRSRRSPARSRWRPGSVKGAPARSRSSLSAAHARSKARCMATRVQVGGARMILQTLWAVPPSMRPYGPGMECSARTPSRPPS